MKINRHEIVIWYSLQLTVAVAGAVAVLWGLWPGIALALIGLPINFMALHSGWLARETPEKNKPLADGIAVGGLLGFLFFLFQSGLMEALLVLLYLAMLALATQTDNHRKLFMALVVSFVFVVVGATEATHGAYLIVMAAYCVLSAFTLTEVWLDLGQRTEHDHQSDVVVQGPPLMQRATVAGIMMGLAVLIYLLMPRLDALNLGAQVSSSPDYYHSDEWSDNAEPPSDDAPESLPELDKQNEEYQDLKQITELSEFDSQTREEFRYRGFNERFDIDQMGQHGSLPPDAIVLRMKAPHGGYLRVRSFDHFDGTTWSSSVEDISRKQQTGAQGYVRLGEDIQTANFQHTITLETSIPAWLPLAGEPVELWVPSTVIALDQFDHPLLPGVLQQGVSYTVQSQLTLLDERPLHEGPAPRTPDLQIPANFDPRITQLAQRVTANTTSNYELAKALEQHLRSEYDYSLASVTASQNYTPLPEFLFEHRQGHCEYFASAMTMMLRSLGVPARLATGFSVTTRNPLTGYFEARVLDGHAWTEAWIDGRWVTFEPTAYFNFPSPDSSAITAQQITDYAQDMLTRERLTQDAGSDSRGFSLAALFSQLWVWVYAAMVWVLSWIKLLIVGLWPLWLGLTVLAIVAAATRHWWWSTWRRCSVGVMSAWRLYRLKSTEKKQNEAYARITGQCVANVVVMLAGEDCARQPQEDILKWYQRISEDRPDLLASPALERFVRAQYQYYYQDNSCPDRELITLAQVAARTTWSQWRSARSARASTSQ